ncbi:carbon starvation regulatory protein [Neocallimastix californiae]|jgi:carbon starvation protein|uniref:Carbon starvation regulatory protein n=1 Tax=Neocallimastix californiae TaxID=1754190 RepID=A0A1Y2AQN0_9FUNG|nr:carbon starvation regulatory protein [Neocallimastix californiae]|eukprot:ORY24620.1 carbon starvation regulatory protein [Neocallimastix californiae]
MNALVLFIISVIILGLGYVFYGGWLNKVWGVKEGEEEDTPAHNMEDGVDYVPTKAPVLMGHHFSSIAGAGPITGPIGAAIFGWLPVTLWVLIGGIFFGGVHDFGALYASICHKGQSIGEIISANMSRRAKRLFIIFSYLTLILVVAAFSSIVATSFGATFVGGVVDKAASSTNAAVAMVSILFIIIAIIFGFCVTSRNAPMLISTILGIAAIVLCLVIGINFHPIYLSTNIWMIFVGLYIAIASVTPVWILLQPRDYLTSFLLYFMVGVAVVGVIGAHPSMDSFPAYTGFAVDNGNGVQYMFPILFTTVACGAISGFHSLVSSGTTSKQLNKKKEAKPIAYGGMLLECVVAILTLCAISYAYTWNAVHPDNKLTGATGIFAGGISKMVCTIPFLKGMEKSLFTLLVVTYSSFCLTSLDTATRLGRFMFQEFWLEPGQTVKDIESGWKKVMVNPYFATLLTVVLGIVLGLTGYAKIWGLFGAANQLLAGIGLLAVATWLGNVGKNNKMFMFPMGFMMIVTICSLFLTVKNQITLIANGKADWGPYAQAIFGILLIILSIILLIEGVQTLMGKNKKIEEAKKFEEVKKTEEAKVKGEKEISEKKAEADITQAI